MRKFVNNIVAFSLKNSTFIFFLTTVLLVTGVMSYRSIPIEAFPDVTSTRARIITQWAGRSAEEVEKFITLPMMKQMNTIPGKKEVRSTSLFGLSVVTVLFDDKVDDFYAQQYASNRLQNIDLPPGADAEIEAPSGATGEIFRYILESDLPIKEVAAIQEWVVERELLSVPGVADIVSFGGEEKIYEIEINPTQLEHYGLSALEVYEAVSKSNVNVGGDIIDKGSQAYVVRGVGLLDSLEDIENILIDVRGHTPILIKHIAEVHIGAKPRLGQVSLDDNTDVVQGIVVMLRGENPNVVISALKERIADLNERILPDNVKIKPFIDRTKLVDTTVSTVTHNLVTGVILVSFIVFIFLYNWRTTLIVASVIPLSFLFAISLLKMQGLPANLISMGALDFGLLLEGTLVIVEQVFVSLQIRSNEIGQERFIKSSKLGVIREGVGKVATPIFFSLFILIIALLPIFSFQEVEGKMFSPLAYTLGYALIGSLLLSLTYVPAMCKVLLKKGVSEKENSITRFFRNNLYKLHLYTFQHMRWAIASFVLLLLVCVVKFANYGSEFLPSLNEGAIYVRASLPNSINLKESVGLSEQIKQEIQDIEEIDFILTQTGRPNDGTDPTGFFNIEFHIELKAKKDWARNVSKEVILQELRAKMETFPGISFGFSQPIQDNVEEYVAGVKSALVIKVFGEDLFQLEEIASQVAASIQDVRGITDLNIYKNIGLPELRIQLHDHKMAKYGVATSDAQSTIEMAIGGQAASQFYENERVFDIQLRYNKRNRESAESIGRILVPGLHGEKVPLKEIATIDYHTGPAFIYREGNSRYIGIGFSIEGRDLGSTIAEAKERVAAEVNLPTYNKMEWAGEFESKDRATKRLAMAVPISLLLILFLLYMNFGNTTDVLISSLTLAFAFIGGFLSLWISNTIFGISAGIGFIILFGVATIDGIILIGVMKEKLYERVKLRPAIHAAVYSRIRPIVMIALMGSMGLLPAALSQGMGSEIQKPLAIMIVGGLLICTLLSLIIIPSVFYLVYRKKYE